MEIFLGATDRVDENMTRAVLATGCEAVLWYQALLCVENTAAEL